MRSKGCNKLMKRNASISPRGEMPRITVTMGAVGSAEPTRSNAHGNDGNQADEVEEARAGGDVMRMRPMRRGRA